MTHQNISIESKLLVFAIWSGIGVIGLLLVLEGFSRDSYFLGVAGTFSVLVALIAHVIVNAVYSRGFSVGEVALGISSFGILVFAFLISMLLGAASMADFYIGVTFFGVIALGFATYLVTRYGLRGAFSRFHVDAVGKSPATNLSEK